MVVLYFKQWLPPFITVALAMAPKTLECDTWVCLYMCLLMPRRQQAQWASAWLMKRKGGLRSFFGVHAGDRGTVLRTTYVKTRKTIAIDRIVFRETCSAIKTNKTTIRKASDMRLFFISKSVNWIQASE